MSENFHQSEQPMRAVESMGGHRVGPLEPGATLTESEGVLQVLVRDKLKEKTMRTNRKYKHLSNRWAGPHCYQASLQGSHLVLRTAAAAATVVVVVVMTTW